MLIISTCDSRYSPELGTSSKEHKRKRKKKSLEIEDTLPHPRITIKVSFADYTVLGFTSLYLFLHRLNPYRYQLEKWRRNQIHNAFTLEMKWMTTRRLQFFLNSMIILRHAEEFLLS